MLPIAARCAAAAQVQAQLTTSSLIFLPSLSLCLGKMSLYSRLCPALME